MSLSNTGRERVAHAYRRWRSSWPSSRRSLQPAAARLDDDEKVDLDLIDVTGRVQNQWVINESGLYSLILRSDKPDG